MIIGLPVPVKPPMTHKRFSMKIKQTLLSMAFLTLLAGCGGGGGGGGAATQIQGVVTDTMGVPIAGVAITVGTATATTDALGMYTLAVGPAANLKVSAAKAGLAKTFDIVTLANGQTVPLNFTLQAVGKSNVLTGMSANPTAADSGRGATVALPAGSIVDGNNNVIDNATVDITSAVPSDRNYTDNFPGLFVGNTGGGADTAIESFGYVTVDINCGVGKTCNLLAGKTADIAIPVAVGADPGTPTIDLWSLNETTGKWVHEGTAARDATVNPVVYRATVSHFSTYNLDRAIEDAIPFTITVKNESGAIVPNAQVVITSTNNNVNGAGVSEGRGTTGAAGTVEFASVAPGNVAVTASSGNLAGTGYLYDVTNGKGSMTVILYPSTSKQISVVYLENGVEKPASSATEVFVMSTGSSGHVNSNAVLNANGQAVLILRSGLSNYSYSAYANINGVSYSLNGTVASVAAVPSKWVMTASGGN